jgi:hypothetical protein
MGYAGVSEVSAPGGGVRATKSFVETPERVVAGAVGCAYDFESLQLSERV